MCSLYVYQLLYATFVPFFTLFAISPIGTHGTKHGAVRRFIEGPLPHAGPTLAAHEALEVIRLPVVDGVLSGDGPPAGGALCGKVRRALLAVGLALLLPHLAAPVKRAPAPRAPEALGVVGAKPVLDDLPHDRLGARPAPLPHLLRVAAAAHEVVIVVVELSVDEPVVAEDALEALGVPAAGVVAEEAHGLADALLALVALGHRLHALVAQQGVVHVEVVALLEVLAAPGAREAGVVPALVPDGDLLAAAESYRLAALVAEDGVLGVAGAAVDAVVVGVVRSVLEGLVALAAAEVFLVPVLAFSVREGVGKYQLRGEGWWRGWGGVGKQQQY